MNDEIGKCIEIIRDWMHRKTYSDTPYGEIEILIAAYENLYLEERDRN